MLVLVTCDARGDARPMLAQVLCVFGVVASANAFAYSRQEWLVSAALATCKVVRRNSPHTGQSVDNRAYQCAVWGLGGHSLPFVDPFLIEEPGFAIAFANVLKRWSTRRATA